MKQQIVVRLYKIISLCRKALFFWIAVDVRNSPADFFRSAQEYLVGTRGPDRMVAANQDASGNQRGSLLHSLASLRQIPSTDQSHPSRCRANPRSPARRRSGTRGTARW